MSIQMKECCVDCDAYTEREGKHSLYLDDGTGPYCLPCYDHRKVEELESRLAASEAQLELACKWLTNEGVNMKGVVLCPQCGSYEVRCESCKSLRTRLALADACVEVLKDTPSHIGPIAEWWGRRIAALRAYDGKEG